MTEQVAGTPDVEQQRRDFMAANPELYRYIKLRLMARTYNSAGDTASGAVDGHGAANRLWRLASDYERQRREMLPEAQR